MVSVIISSPHARSQLSSGQPTESQAKGQRRRGCGHASKEIRGSSEEEKCKDLLPLHSAHSLALFQRKKARMGFQ